MRSVVRLVVAAAAACAATVTLVLPAHAGTQVVPGTTGLDERTSLTYVPCAGFFGGGATAPGLRVNRGQQAPPLGERSYGMAVSGPGTAAGAVRQTPSIAELGSISMSVNPASAATGVAYVWYAAPDLPAGQAWLGRAELTAAPGWQRVEVSAASFSWQAVDLVSRQPQGAAGPARLADFVAAHGDGPGYVVAGFGCNGASFNLDALTYGATTYDLEGFAATTSIAVGDAAPGQPVTLSGWSERATGARLGDPLVLERLVPGTSRWEPVTGPLLAGADAVVRTTVTPDQPTHYRWRMGEAEYADANVSEPVLVKPVAAEPPPGEGSPQPAPGQDDGQQGQPDQGQPDQGQPDQRQPDQGQQGQGQGDQQQGGQQQDGQQQGGRQQGGQQDQDQQGAQQPESQSAP